MSSIVMDKETIFTDELIRENARLTIQHEADLLRADQLEERLASAPSAQDIQQAVERAHIAEDKLGGVNAMLRRALDDLHFVMAGGDACKVCACKCTFGTGECKPVWKGEEAEE